MKARAWPTLRTSGAVRKQPAMPPADRPVRIEPAQVGGIAGGAEADRDVGEHQPVADRHQRHRDDDAGDRQHGRRVCCCAARSPSACCRCGFVHHAAQTARGRRPARSGKSDIGRTRRNWLDRIVSAGSGRRGLTARRMALDDSDERGPWMKVQAGAAHARQRSAHRPRRRGHSRRSWPRPRTGRTASSRAGR